MPKPQLPQRIRFVVSRPPVDDYGPPPIELVERALEALREWTPKTPRCWGDAPSSAGATTRTEDVAR